MSKVNITAVNKALKTIKNGDTYDVSDIIKMRIIANTKGKPCVFTAYRLIKSGKLPSISVGIGEKTPRYNIKGVDLRKFLKDRYELA